MKLNENTILLAPSQERVRWFEESYRVRLPADYKDFIRTSNGAIPETNIFTDGGNERVVERFLPLFDDPKAQGDLGWLDITAVISQLDSRLINDENLVGMNVIPIAALFGGDFVCLDFRSSPVSPSIGIWNHEMSEDFQPVIVPVFNRFSELLMALRNS